MISALLKPTLVINGKKYKVMKQIGEGGFAFVYNVMSTGKEDSGERYALKKMICQTDEQLDEAKKEIDTMVKIKHENVLPLLDFAYTLNKKGQKEVLLLLPLYMGSVQTIIDQGHGFPYCGFADGLDVLKILRCCIEGLSAIHSCGIRHADLKPANILLTESYHAVITDFGSVAPFPVEVHTRAEALAIQDQAASFTTASYRAPELYNTPSSCVIAGESDVWSFGCLMFCMMYSRSPFESAVEGLSTLSIISAHYQVPEGNLWPQEYLDIIGRCLQPDPALRATLSSLQEQLQCIPCPPLNLIAVPPPAVKNSPVAPSHAAHGPLKHAPMPGLGSSTSTTSSAVSTGQIAFSASSASFTDDGGSFPHTPVSPASGAMFAMEVNFANFPAPPAEQQPATAAATEGAIHTTGSKDEFASSSSGLSDLFFGGSVVNSIADSYVIAEGFETMSNFTSGNNSPMHHGSAHGGSGHHLGSHVEGGEGSVAKSSNPSFEGFEFMEAPGGNCSPRAATNYGTEETAASLSSACSGFGSSLTLGIAEGSACSGCSAEDAFAEEDEFGEFTTSTQDIGAALDKSTALQEQQQADFAHFPTTGAGAVTHSGAGNGVTKECSSPHGKATVEIVETVDVWKLITEQAMPSDPKSGHTQRVEKEGPVNMMRLGGFPKRWSKKQVWLVLTPTGVILRKDSAPDSRIHEVLSLHRPAHLTPTDTLSVGLNGLLVQGSSPVPLPTKGTAAGAGASNGAHAHTDHGSVAGAEDWVQISPRHASSVTSDRTFTSESECKEGCSPTSTTATEGPFRSLFTAAKFEISFESKDVMNDWMDAIMDCREALL